jgi:predicted HicB family RNase H-like nuclease
MESEFRYMVDQHLADCEREGKPAEQPYKGVFNVRISPKLHKKASHAAIKNGITLNQMIRQALEKELDDN